MGGEGELQKRLREFIRKECDACLEIGKLDKATKHWERTHGTVYRLEELLKIVEEMHRELLEEPSTMQECICIPKKTFEKWFGKQPQK